MKHNWSSGVLNFPVICFACDVRQTPENADGECSKTERVRGQAPSYIDDAEFLRRVKELKDSHQSLSGSIASGLLVEPSKQERYEMMLGFKRRVMRMLEESAKAVRGSE